MTDRGYTCASCLHWVTQAREVVMSTGTLLERIAATKHICLDCAVRLDLEHECDRCGKTDPAVRVYDDVPCCPVPLCDDCHRLHLAEVAEDLLCVDLGGRRPPE